MKKKFCSYCGEPLENNCDCIREAEEAHLQMIEDYENSPETHAGWRQQDIIDMRRMER